LQNRKILLFFLCTALFAQQKGTFTDARDGKVYKTVKIGEQVWMAENLNYEASGSKCYNNKLANCKKYGRLYDWKTAITACPNGWHLPTNDEWDILYRYADGTSGTENPCYPNNVYLPSLGRFSCDTYPYDSKTAGKLLKAISGWNNDKGKSGNGTDVYGFSALPGGIGDPYGAFSSVGNRGYWYSANERAIGLPYARIMLYNTDDAVYNYGSQSFSISVRCLQDTTQPKGTK
jgi:uncharacterized protein (TIGR02145 family)